MDQIRKKIKDNGFSWHSTLSKKKLYEALTAEIEQWGYEADFIGKEKTKKSKISWARELVLSMVGDFKIADPKLFIEKFKIVNNGRVNLEYVLKGSPVWINDNQMGPEVFLSFPVSIKKELKDQKKLEEVIENGFKEYKIKRLFEPEKAERELEKMIERDVIDTVRNIETNKKIINWLNEISVEIIEDYEEWLKREK